MGGISLIEMLIALLVLSFGLLGMAGLQAYSLRNNNSAYHRSQATALGYEAIDLMRANAPAAVARQEYNVGLGGLPTGTTRPDLDVISWKNRLATALPTGDGQVACDPATRICTVTVQWDDTRGATGPQQFIVSSSL
jgi:type IV pilus assembly protein PilV